MKDVKTHSNISDSNLSDPTATFGPTALWEVGVLGSLHGTILLCGIVFNSAVISSLIKHSQNGWTVVNQLMTYKSLTGIGAVSVAVPLYLYLLITGDRDPTLCIFYEWYLFTFNTLSYSFIIALGLLRYGYVFHYQQLQTRSQKTILTLPLGFTFGMAALFVSVRYWLEPSLDKGIRVTLCATRFTTTYKNYWLVFLFPHVFSTILGFAYLRILYKLGSFLPGQGVPLSVQKKVNFVNARTSALTVIVTEFTVIMAQIWNIIDPKILPSQHEFFFQEMSAQFVYLIHFVPAVLYCVNQYESQISVCTFLRRIVPSIKPRNRVEVVV